MIETNKIFIGDTLQTLKTFPDNSVDIVVTSPPYNKMGAKGELVGEVEYKNFSDTRSETDYQAEQIDVLNELFRVVSPGGHIFYNHKLRWIGGSMIHPLEWIFNSKWKSGMRQEIIWDRNIAGNLRGWRFWQTEERIYWMQKGLTKGNELKSRHAKMTSIWKIRPESGVKSHPAPFPVELPTRCIYSVADTAEGLTVLDPYSGSGSTLVAAKYLKHNYIGIDCSQEYADFAKHRLTSDTDYGRMQKEMSKHVVTKSYSERKKKKSEKSVDNV